MRMMMMTSNLAAADEMKRMLLTGMLLSSIPAPTTEPLNPFPIPRARLVALSPSSAPIQVKLSLTRRLSLLLLFLFQTLTKNGWDGWWNWRRPNFFFFHRRLITFLRPNENASLFAHSFMFQYTLFFFGGENLFDGVVKVVFLKTSSALYITWLPKINSGVRVWLY